ncbi:Kelch repeat-containing protein [Sorangium sp. So ce426]|uniref:Kelch repeat-containing protein n=1 Tax=Sorangium sp. So ce426 TaxID=3133312 RepID=UPI003F5B70EF
MRGTYRLAGEIKPYRAKPAIALLDDERALITGGHVSDAHWSQVTSESALIVDEDLQSAHPATSMHQARAEHTATKLSDGRVLVAGGTRLERVTVDPPALAGVENFDPKTGTWTEAAPMHEARRRHEAILLRDGRVLVAGGRDRGDVARGAEVYDPRANRWSALTDLSRARFYSALVELRDGRAILIGGNVYGAGAIDNVDIFDHRAQRGRQSPPCQSRDGHTRPFFSATVGCSWQTGPIGWATPRAAISTIRGATNGPRQTSRTFARIRSWSPWATGACSTPAG